MLNKNRICIGAVTTHYSNNIRTIEELKRNSGISAQQADSIGIEQVHVTDRGVLTTDEATIVAQKILKQAKIKPEKIDEVVYISEGMGDYLYMDTSKSVLRNIQGRMDNVVYTYDVCRGNCGTIGVIKFVGNQLIGNKEISTAIIDTALLWEKHSKNRWLGTTFLGDGAGAVLLQENAGSNEILSTAYDSMSEYNLVSGFKYGGTKYELPKKALEAGEFYYGILDETHLQGVLNNVVDACVQIGQRAMEKAGLSVDEIDCIGIAGFSKKYNDEILGGFEGIDSVIDPLSNKGFLGTVGVIEVLDNFVNSDDYKEGETMLVIANGIDSNVEAMVVRK